MESEIIEVTQREWLAIQREKARRQGYYHVDDIGGSWSESDRDIYLKYHRPMKVLYLHDLSYSGTSDIVGYMCRLLDDTLITAPDLPIDPQDALEMIRNLIEQKNIDLIIGVGMGGMFAQKLRGYNKILVNPSFHLSEYMRSRIGVCEYLTSREDGVTHYNITEELCDKYEEIERLQFEHISKEEQLCTKALFGSRDNIVDCSSEYSAYYTQLVYFDGEHSLTENDIKLTLINEVESFRKAPPQFEICSSESILSALERKFNRSIF